MNSGRKEIKAQNWPNLPGRTLKSNYVSKKQALAPTLKGEELAVLEIRDSSSKPRLSERATGAFQTLDISHLPPGMYFLQAERSDAIHVQSFVKIE